MGRWVFSDRRRASTIGALCESYGPDSKLRPLTGVPVHARITTDYPFYQRCRTCGLREGTGGSAGSSRAAGHGRVARPAGTTRATGPKGGCRTAGPTGSKGGRPAGAARRTGTGRTPGSTRAARRSGARRSARPSRSEGRQGGQRQSRRVREQDPANRLWIRRVPGRLRDRRNRDLGILWRKRTAGTYGREGRAMLQQRSDRTTSRSDLREKVIFLSVASPRWGQTIVSTNLVS
jgi:hypothetical protein